MYYQRLNEKKQVKLMAIISLLNVFYQRMNEKKQLKLMAIVSLQ